VRADTPDTAQLTRRPIVLGTVGGVLMLAGSLGAAAGDVRDPFLGDGPLSWMHYGHGRALASIVLYGGYVLLVSAWVLLGRHVLAGRIGVRPLLVASACWIAPMMLAPALFTRDPFSYLVQGALALQGLNPYTAAPTEVGSPELLASVHPFWQGTPAPYGPLFILMIKGVVWVTGSNVLAGVLLTRLVQLVGLVVLVWALPRLVRHLGGSLPVAVWLAVAGPITVVHLVGGAHNDLLMIGFLAAGAALVLDGRHVAGVAVVTLAVAVKASAVVALPFLVWVWAGHLTSTRARNVARAMSAAVGTFVAVFAASSLLAWVDVGWLGSVNASSRLVNWLSPPTAAGELIHAVVNVVVDVPKGPFITVTRIIGTAILVVYAVWQWWQARAGGPDAVRRAALVLFAVAVLSATMLPWYLTWSLCLAAALPWRPRQLAVMVGVSAFMVAPYSPDGETMLYVWPLMFAAAALSVLAAVSLVRPDPLRFGSAEHVEEDRAAR
jgi:alpha-1,6-mannosyltransferase